MIINSGFLAERMNLRYYLTLGSLLCGLGNTLFGLAYLLRIHSFAYFLVIQVFEHSRLHEFNRVIVIIIKVQQIPNPSIIKLSITAMCAAGFFG